MFAGLPATGMKDCGVLSVPRKEKHPVCRSEKKKKKKKGEKERETLPIILATGGCCVLYVLAHHQSSENTPLPQTAIERAS